MSKFTIACLSMIMAASAAGAVAQSSMSSDSMSPSGGAMAPGHMTKSQMAMMHKCQGMSHDAMMKNAGCVKMMKAHPDMMKGGDAMSSGTPH